MEHGVWRCHGRVTDNCKLWMLDGTIVMALIEIEISGECTGFENEVQF